MLQWNASGLKNVKKNIELLKCADIVIIQETWIEKKHLEKEIKKLDKNFQWHGKAAAEKEKKRGRASGGQLIGIKKKLKAEWKIQEWEYGLTLKIKGSEINEEYIIISVYNNDRKNLQTCVDKLEEEIENVAIENRRLIITGDFNARIGEEQGIAECGIGISTEIVKRKSEDKQIRSEGRKMIRWCEEKAMIIMNGRTSEDQEGKTTCIGYGEDNGSVLDLVLIEMDEELAIPKWFKGLRVAVQEGSDHLPVISRLEWQKIEEIESKKLKKIERIKWSEGKANEFIEEWMKIREQKEKNEEEKKKENLSAEDRWKEIISGIKEAAEKSKMKVKYKNNQKRRAEWDDGSYTLLRKEHFKKLNNFRKRRSWTEKKIYLESSKKLKEHRRQLINEWIEKKQKEVGKATNLTEWWKAMNWFRRKNAKTENNISREEWQRHFMNLLEGNKISEENNNKTDNEKEDMQNDNEGNEKNGEKTAAEELNEPLTWEEVQEVLKKLKNNKAAGEDEITAEFLKNLPPEGEEEITEIIKEMWKQEIIPKNWKIARIFPIHKKGNIEDVGNYRGVSLLDVGYKILTMIMAKRLGKWLDQEEKLTEAQAGFRRKRGTIEQIFILNTAIGNRLKKKGKIYTAFVDLKKAFDKVDREILWKKAKKLGIDGKFLRIVKEIYKDTRCEVITEEGISQQFETKKGVRQGCPLSSALFNIYINDIEDMLRRKNEGGTAIGNSTNGIKIFVLMYADDLVLMAEEETELQRMLITLEKWTKLNKMEVNTEKTKIMVFKNGGREKKEKTVWRYGQYELEEVKEFNYLGFWFNRRNNYNTQTRKVTGKVQQLINKAWGEAKRAGINELKRKLFLMDMTVKAGALYGVEIWGWQRWATIERVQAKFVKASMALPKNTPDYIWKMEAGRRGVEVEAFKRSINFIIKVLKLNENRWAHKCLREEIRGIKNGEPTQWGRRIQEALREFGDGQIINMIWNKQPVETIEKRVKELIRIKEEQDIQKDWTKIDKSSYCDYYKDIKKIKGMEAYWNKKEIKEWQKITWAKWRCGCATRGYKKGYENDRCRGCEIKKETIEHVTTCGKIIEKLTEHSKNTLERWRNGNDEEEWRKKILAKLNQEINEDLCKIFSEISGLLEKETIT